MDQQRNERLWWALIIVCFVVAWPIALILLYFKIFKGVPKFQNQKTESGTAGQTEAHQPQWNAQPEAFHGQSQRQAGSYSTPKNATGTATRWSQSTAGVRSSDLHGSDRQAPQKSGKKGKSRKSGLFLRILGGGLSGFFGIVAVDSLIELLSEGAGVWEILKNVNPLMIFCALGIALLSLGIQRGKQNKRLSRYRTLLGSSLSLNLHTAARTTGIRYERVLADMQTFTDKGEFGNAFVDVERGLLIVDPEHYTPPAEEPQHMPNTDQEIAKQAVQAAKQSDNEVLAQIKAANDAIENEEISQKIDEIGLLTAKIFRLVEENPDKESEIRSFTAYYLPQTLKILNAYAKLERQGVEGQNISEAKLRIEAMLDKLTDGYAAQLDRLFGTEVLDITSDISVMEQMLAKDGLLIDELQKAQMQQKELTLE